MLRGVREDGFDGLVEETGDAEGEGEARVVALGFDGVDGLAGDAELFGEDGLGPVAFGAEDFEAVFHGGGGRGVSRSRGWFVGQD